MPGTRNCYSRIPDFQCRDYGDNLSEKRDRDEDGHDDEKTAVFLIGDEESVDRHGKCVEAEGQHAHGDGVEIPRPEK